MSDTILISGGGISGLALACALRLKGLPVELVERKTEMTDEGGIGLTLVGNALRALDSIGLAKSIVSAGMPADHYDVATPEGKVVGQTFTTGPWGADIPGHCSVTRAVLHRVLADRAYQLGVRMRAGLAVEMTTPRSDGVVVALSDGSEGHYRLCVAAEGQYSACRRRLFPGVEPVLTGQASWRALVPRPRDLKTTQLHFGGVVGVVGICPISQEDAYLYIVEHMKEGHREDDSILHLTMHERLVGHYGGLVAELLTHLKEPTQILYRPLPVMIAPNPWYRDGVVLIGDAAHVNPPVLAQGAAMGIEDGIVLAEELASYDTGTALQRFMERRFERVRLVVETSHQLAQWEVENRKDVDAAGVLRQAAVALAEPI